MKIELFYVSSCLVLIENINYRLCYRFGFIATISIAMNTLRCASGNEISRFEFVLYNVEQIGHRFTKNLLVFHRPQTKWLGIPRTS